MTARQDTRTGAPSVSGIESAEHRVSVAAAPRIVQGWPGFAAATVGLVTVAAFLLTLVFRGSGDATAIWVSAAVATAVQIASFPVVRGLTTSNLMLGWGAGSVIRVLSLIVYGVLAAKVLGLALTAALVSLAVFYFLSMVIEPLFLRR
jgi:hypothetical protein